MRVAKRQLIQSFADYVREVIGSSQLTFDNLREFITAQGGTLEFFDASQTKEKESVTKTAVDAFTIKLKQANSEIPHKLSLAHEIGHLMLHMKLGTDAWNDIAVGTAYTLKYTVCSISEDEANEFAAALLLPEKNFTQAVRDAAADLKKLAERFQVDESIVYYRGRSLNIW